MQSWIRKPKNNATASATYASYIGIRVVSQAKRWLIFNDLVQSNLGYTNRKGPPKTFV